MNKHFLMIGFAGKRAYVEPVLKAGAKVSLLISEKKYKDEYADIFYRVFKLKNIYSWEEIKLVLDKSEKIDAVVTRHEDYINVVGAINEYLGLNGLDYQVAQRFCNKYLMKKKWLKDEVPCANGVCMDNLSKLDAFLEKYSFPLILKKTSAVHSNFVLKVKSKEDLLEKVDFLKNQVRGYINSKPVKGFKTRKKACQILLEEMLIGRELTIDTFVSSGEFTHTPICEYTMPRELGLNDNYLPIRVMPTFLTKEQEKLIQETVEKALCSLGANNCVCHTEVFLDEKKNTCTLIESTPRGGGNRAEMTLETTGFDYSLAVFYAAAGMSIKTVPEIRSSLAVVEYFAERKGFLEEIKIDFLRNNSAVSNIRVRNQAGDMVNQAKFGGKNIVIFYVQSNKISQANKLAIKLFKQLRNSIKINFL